MVQLGTLLNVTDKTGVMFVRCIKVIKNFTKKIAKIGEVIIVSVNRINPRKFVNVKIKHQRRFIRGTLHRGLIIRNKVNFERIKGVFLKFNQNTVVLVTKSVVPVSNRVYGPIFREFCMKWPSLGCVCNNMI